MASQGCTVLVLLAVLAAPTSAARPSLSDMELNLENQIVTQDDNQSNAVGQEDTQVQNKSLAGTPSTERIRLSSASASFGTAVHGAFAAGQAITSFQSIGGTIIMKGVSIWVKQNELDMIYGYACTEYMKMKSWGPNGKSGERFSVILRSVWDSVIVPSLIREGRKSGDRAELDRLVTVAQNFLLYTETFLAVGAYIKAHKDTCPTHLHQIQLSWNQMQEAYDLASKDYYHRREFHWLNDGSFDEDGTGVTGLITGESWDMTDHLIKTDRDKSMSGMKSETETGTEWSMFRWTSALDRILGVAKSLGLYNERGELTAPECVDEGEEPLQMPVVRSTNHGKLA